MLFRLSDVWKSYGGTEILKGVSFQVNPSEKVGLVGRNGAGKTTVFRIITGQEAADEGDVIKMNGLKLGLLDQHVDFGEAETVHTAALSAFKEIHDIEAEMRSLETLMATDHSDAVLERYADLQTAFEHADGFSYAAKAESVLLGMGFPPESWGEDVRTLSGGQKNRLGMVRLLLSNSDVMLLDEPTNHLDVEAVEWLEEFLKTYDRTYVVISHDRYFLDRTTNRVIEIDRGQAVTYKGNYSKYLEERELRREQQIREYENQQALINKTQEFIRKNLEGQKTKQAKSRRTLLARMERIEAVTSEKSGGNFGLRQVERTGNNVLTAEDLAIGYDTKVLAKGLNFSLFRGDALGIIGGNGTGKTTLIKTLLGNIRELGGKLHWGTKTNIGYYSQNLEGLEPRNEVVQELRRVAPMADNGTLRGFLAKFLFVGEDVFKPVSALSGGEKGRLALAKLIYSQKNVLVLDEPTNHLDIPSRESLENALDEYDGTLIVVSHDRFFLDKIANQMLSFENDGRVLSFDGNYTEFHDWKIENAVSGVQSPRVQASQPAAAPAAEKTSRPASALSKNQINQLEKRIKQIEAEIPALEAEAAGLTKDMSDPKVASDYPRLAELTEKLTKTESRVKALYEEWESAAEQLGG
ncbi:MAG: ABC-F family ATP-binding cassette domain-containing protein [Pyrinomonadaceae bacterium]|nr:ABC-F family ATP-binding cassette domain-containing protein [Pyrinomonadaceae bacterium]MBP6211947.1 ABC-F family ATP-binding cassette domain-containing protein [Pyrinomonadaceae bacterium]